MKVVILVCDGQCAVFVVEGGRPDLTFQAVISEAPALDPGTGQEQL
jgi:hypothetical protein